MRIKAIFVTFLTSLLVACGGNGPGSSSGDDLPTVPVPSPHPLEVKVTLDESHMLSQIVPVTGGTLSVTADDGAVYTLTIPAAALLADTKITMTPILSLEGSPITGGRLLGVELKPHGLRLYDFATLTITPPGRGNAAKAIAFTTQEGGKEFHLYPLVLNPTIVSMKLMHFSEHGAYVRGENDPIPVEDPVVAPDITTEIMPNDWEGQMEQMMEDLIRKEREAQLKGEEGDPQFEDKLTAILNTFFEQIIEPMLSRIARDCTYAEMNTSKVLGWNRNVSLLGFDEQFVAKTAAVSEAVFKGVDNCWTRAVGECIDQSDSEQVAKVNKYARMNQILGGDPAKYNPKNPDLQCDDACSQALETSTWEGAIKLSYSNSGQAPMYGVTQAVSLLRSAAVRFTLTERLDDPSAGGVFWFGSLTEGTAEIFDTHTMTYPSGDRLHFEHKGQGTPILGKDKLILYLHRDCSYYNFEAPVTINAQDDKRGQVTSTGVARLFFFNMPTLSPLPTSLEVGGDGTFPVWPDPESETRRPFLSILGGYAALLEPIVGGWENMGKADVAWVVSPIAKP